MSSQKRELLGGDVNIYFYTTKQVSIIQGPGISSIMALEDVALGWNSMHNRFLVRFNPDKFNYVHRLEVSDIITDDITLHRLPDNKSRRSILIEVFCAVNEAYLSYVDDIITEAGDGSN